MESPRMVIILLLLWADFNQTYSYDCSPIVPNDYKSNDPPVSDLKIDLDYVIVDITKVDEFHNGLDMKLFVMTQWTDDRINKDWVIETNGTYRIAKNELNCIWKPFIWMRRLHEGHEYSTDVFRPSIQVHIIDGHTKIFYVTNFILKLMCPMDFRNYPFDTQKCRLTFPNCKSSKKSFMSSLFQL